MEIDINLMIMVVVGTISSLYGLVKTLKFKVEENRKQREHLRKQRNTKCEWDFKAKKLEKSPNMDTFLDKFDISKLLEGVESEDDIEDLPIPSWAKPLAKGFLEKFLQKDTLDDEKKKLDTQNY